MALNLDLNTRERTRYSEQLERIATDAQKAADALRNLDDDNFIVHIALFGLMGPTIMRELKPVLEETIEAENLKKSLDRE